MQILIEKTFTYRQKYTRIFQRWKDYKTDYNKELLFVCFQACHNVVPPGPSYEQCVSETCACNQGGDCECLCTAVSSYAVSCALHGIHIKWRSQDLCR